MLGKNPTGGVSIEMAEPIYLNYLAKHLYYLLLLIFFLI
jgi:hypothetical protein